MSTLTALKLQRELAITRLALQAPPVRPTLELRWSIDPQSGRAVATWVAAGTGSVAPTVMTEPALS